MELLHRTFQGEIDREASDKAGEGILVHPISSLSIDSHGTIIWYKDVEWDGQYYKTTARDGGDYIPILDEHGGGLFDKPEIIGVNMKIWDTDDLLMVESQFNLKKSLGRERYQEHKDGFKKGWSIGFKPAKELKDEEADEFLEANNHPARGVPVFLGNEIWEYSSVVFPSNPDAYNSALIELKQEIRELVRDARNSDDLRELKDELNKLNKRLTELETRRDAVSGEGWKAMLKLARKKN